MTPLWMGLAAAFGAIVGSFLNVVIHRMPLEQPLGLFAKNRSQCPECEATIRWFDNIPVISYLVLLGKCRACGWRIPARYPLVEITTAALFALAALRVAEMGWTPPWLAWGVAAAFSAILVAASAIDFQHQILPDKLTLRAGPVVCIIGALGVPAIHGTVLFGSDLAAGGIKPGLASLLVGAAGAVVGAGIIWLIRVIGEKALKKEAMGLGDVKFMGMCGILLGPLPTAIAIMVAMFAGSVIGIGIWIITRDSKIPFGPFLALGVLAMLFYGEPITAILESIYFPPPPPG